MLILNVVSWRIGIFCHTSLETVTLRLYYIPESDCSFRTTECTSVCFNLSLRIVQNLIVASVLDRVYKRL